MIYFVLTLACALVLYPLLWVVKIAFTGDVSVNLFGSPANFAAFTGLQDAHFFHSLAISLVISLVATLTGLAFSATAAFSIARMRFSGRQTVLRALLLTQMFPGILLSVPLYLLLAKTHLLGSLFGLALVDATVSVPFSIWMLKGFFENIPRELEEAARLDGATDFQIFFRVMLPLVRPGLFVTGLYAFMGTWNEYILAATFLNRDDRYPAPVVLKNMIGSFTTQWGPFALGSLLVSLPVIAAFFVLQRQLVSGLLAGAVKE